MTQGTLFPAPETLREKLSRLAGNGDVGEVHTKFFLKPAAMKATDTWLKPGVIETHDVITKAKVKVVYPMFVITVVAFPGEVLPYVFLSLN